MKQTKPRKYTTKKQQEEVAKVLAHFFKESSAIVRAARKAARQKYPDLFTTPVK